MTVSLEELDSSIALGQRGTGIKAPSSYNSTTYTTSGLMYPDDLMGKPEYGGNYVIFYLNVHEDSKVLSGPDGATVDPGQVIRGKQGNVATTNISEGAAVTMSTVTGAAFVSGVTGGGGGITNTIVNKVTAGNVTLTSKAGAIGDAVLGAAIGAAVADYAQKKKMKRLKRCIALHMPTDLSIKYGVSYEDESMAGTLAMGMTLQSGVDYVSGNSPSSSAQAKDEKASAGVVDSVRSAIKGAISNTAVLAYGTGLALQTPGIGRFLAKRSGLQANPKREQLFKNVDFRTFSFQYQFFPRSAEEARAVQNIISEFKLHMHPEFKDSNEFLYLVPSEFDIFYYNNGTENMNLHRHTSCVLTDISIQYTPQGIYSSFPGGHPTQINMVLTFKELALLTKEDIKDGY